MIRLSRMLQSPQAARIGVEDLVKRKRDLQELLTESYGKLSYTRSGA